MQQSRIKQERDWKLNLAFYRGQQWVWFNRFTGMVMDIPSPDVGDGPRYRVRLTSNQILPGVQGLLAMMTKTKPVITATPETGAERDIRAAQMAEQLFEHWWRTLSLKAKLGEALLWSILGSAGYWKITWDPFAGRPMTFMVGPDGQPILDPTLADLFRDELMAEGKDPKQFEKTVYMGEIRIDVIPPDSLFILDGAPNVYESKAIVCKHPMTPDEVKMRFGKDVTANASTIATSFANVGAGTITTQDSSSGPDKNVREVYIGYFAPSPIMPKGRYVVFIDDPDEILYDGPWPYPIVDLPIVEFPGPRVPGSQTNEALVTHARPLQKELNRTISQIVMHKNLTLKPQILAPQGSLAQRITDEPGAIIEFMPVGGAIPQWREMPSIPAYVFEHLKDIQMRLDRLFNLQAISRGDVPPNVEAGIAIDLLQEAAVDQIAPVIQAMEDGLARAGDIMAAFARHFYTEPRMIQIIGPGGVTKARRFLGSDIEGGFSFHAEAGSGLPRTRAGRIARVEQLVGMGVLRADQAWKHLDIADLKGVSAMFAADEEQAYREIDKINKGQPLNVQAMQQAMAALQQGIDPNTGQPLDGTVDPQRILMDASLKPHPFENYQVHLDTHALYMKSVEFESLPPDVQGRHIQHYNLTLQAMMALPARPEPQAVRTTLQLKGTIDPKTAAEVLQHSGVPEANPADLAQPPLETWVSDSLDKPDAEAAGNDPLDDAERIQAMQHAEEQHQAQQAKTAADIALVHKRISQLGKTQPKSASPRKAA